MLNGLQGIISRIIKYKITEMPIERKLQFSLESLRDAIESSIYVYIVHSCGTSTIIYVHVLKDDCTWQRVVQSIHLFHVNKRIQYCTIDIDR